MYQRPNGQPYFMVVLRKLAWSIIFGLLDIVQGYSLMAWNQNGGIMHVVLGTEGFTVYPER